MGGNSTEIELMCQKLPKWSQLYSPACVIVSLFMSLCLLSFWTVGWANEYRSQEELESLRGKIDALQQRLDTDREKESSVASALLDLEKQLAHLNLEQRHSKAELEDIRVRKMQIRLDLYNMQLQEKQVRKSLSNVVRSGFVLGQKDSISLILNGEDPTRSLQILAMHRYIVDARKNQVDEIRNFRTKQAMVVASLESQEAEMNRLTASLEENKLSLIKTESNRQSQLDTIRASLRSNEDRVAEYKRQEKKLRQLLNQLAQKRHDQVREQAERKKNNSALKQTNSQPSVADANSTDSMAENVAGRFDENRGNLQLPAKGRVLKKFGQIRPESGLKWDGMMFAVQGGQRVNAIFDGQVVFSDWFGSYGQLLVLDHGDGYMSLYGHNQLLEVQLGSMVRAGDKIALAGNTGGLLTPGLYFEIRHNGVPANPLKWCRI